MKSIIQSVALAASISLGATTLNAASAPDFNLRNLRGERVNLKALLAKGPVLLDFWATYCKPCVKAMPKLQKIHEKYGKSGLTVLGVNVDGPRGQNRVKPFLRARKVSFPIALDSDSAVMRRMQVNVLPTTLLITADGEIALRQVGYNSKNADLLLAAVEALFPDAGADVEAKTDASADQ
ncbi:MAG: TlpA disulfide reductase family protein [Gemmatimonadetes bacterium]|nr:TlpA disulfide reductase family protein [Gemmatimonadota bacterium]MDE3256942.1 TlpA disulfide reductase family protein [Gemmatimonadota bacterium]